MVRYNGYVLEGLHAMDLLLFRSYGLYRRIFPPKSNPCRHLELIFPDIELKEGRDVVEEERS